MKPNILISMPTQSHVEIAIDELTGLQDLGYTCHAFPYAAKEGFSSALSRFLVIIKNAFNLIKISNQFKPDIIYFNSRVEFKAGIRDAITIFLVRTFYFKKVLFMIKSHGSELDIFGSNNYLIKKIVLPFLKKKVAGWLFLSSEEKNKVNQLNFFLPEKVFVTKNIVRTNQFKINPNFRSKHHIPTDHKILLFVGRIIKEKGIFEVINAFVKLNTDEKATLIIVGNGSALDAAKESIGQLKLNHKIIFTGFIPEQDVVEYYSNSDILVFPTIFPEGFPMALFNSVAAGLSIITTPTRAATDFLSEPANCLWVEPKNSESVLSALVTLLKTDELMRTMSINNILKGELFSQNQVVKELSATIDNIFQTKL